MTFILRDRSEIKTSKDPRPRVSWPRALRAVRGWLDLWVMLRRYWNGWSSLPHLLPCNNSFRREEIAQLLEALLEKHPTGTIYIAWDNANTHEDNEVEIVV